MKKRDNKEETCKFLALPIDEMTTHTARMMAKLKIELEEELEEEEEEEEEENKEKMKNLKHVKSKAALPKQIAGRQELKIAMMKRENFIKESKHDLIYMERQKAVLELELMTKRSEILKMDKAIAKEERQLQQLEKLIERDNLIFEEFLRQNKKKSVEAQTIFEQESKQKKTAEIKKLNAEIWTITSELAKYEDNFIDYMRYTEILFKLSPPEWQEAQRAKSLKAKVPSDKDAQDERNRDSEESNTTNGLEGKVSNPGRELPSMRETNLLDSSEFEDELEMYFNDPQQLLDLVTELTAQNLSMIQNTTRVEETVEELRHSLETTKSNINEKDEEQLALQINDINQRIDKQKTRCNKLKQKVRLHLSLNTEDQDGLLDALNEKVEEVHRSCLGDRMTNLSTLEKLTSLENPMSLMLLNLESIPKEVLEMMKKINDRECEEKLKEQKEKQKERMRRYIERSLADAKITSGRKLMPRCMPVSRKVKVLKKDTGPAEEEIHAYLFTSDEIV